MTPDLNVGRYEQKAKNKNPAPVKPNASMKQTTKIRIPLSSQRKKKRKRKISNGPLSSFSKLTKPPQLSTPLCSDQASAFKDVVYNSIFISIELPSDLVFTIRALSQRHATGFLYLTNPNRQSIPILLVPMLHASLLSTSEDGYGDQAASAMASTGVTIGLEKDCQRCQLRKLQLHGTKERDRDIAVLEYKDFVRGVWDAAPVSTETKDDEIHSFGSMHMLIEVYLVCCKEHTNTHILEVDLIDSIEDALLMKLNSQKKTSKADAPLGKIKSLNDKWAGSKTKTQNLIDKLVSMKLLLPRLSSSMERSSNSYWFTLPSLNTASRDVCKGRAQVLGKIKRSYNKEIKRTSLETGKSDMPGPFLVGDLLARGEIKTKETASGQFIKLNF